MTIDKLAIRAQNALPTDKAKQIMITRLFSHAIADTFAQDPNSKMRKVILEMADEIWQDMKMPKAIRPEITFKPMRPKAMAGMDLSTGKMYFPCDDLRILTDMAVTDGPEINIAHELQHAKQFYSIAQLLGVDEFERVALEKRNIILDRDWFEQVVDVLGRVKPASKEEKYAKKCLKAYVNYTLPEDSNESFQSVVKNLKYRNNFLERDARKAANTYREGFFEKLAKSLIQRGW